MAVLDYDFEESVGYWIWLTSHVYQQRLNERLAPLRLTFRQFQVLAWLVYEGDMSQTELAERMMLEPPTLVGILDRMEREGWIERRSSPLDRRKKLIGLRDEAGPVWQRMVECLTEVRTAATRGMDEAETAVLKGLLGRVLGNLGAEFPQRRTVGGGHVG